MTGTSFLFSLYCHPFLFVTVLTMVQTGNWYLTLPKRKTGTVDINTTQLVGGWVSKYRICVF